MNKHELEVGENKANELECLLCGSSIFVKREVQLKDASGEALPGFEWAKNTAQCIICRDCGFIHWFMPK